MVGGAQWIEHGDVGWRGRKRVKHGECGKISSNGRVSILLKLKVGRLSPDPVPGIQLAESSEFGYINLASRFRYPVVTTNYEEP